MKVLNIPENEIRALEDGPAAAGRIVPETDLDMAVLHAHVKLLLAERGALPVFVGGSRSNMTATFTLHSTDAWDDAGYLTGALDVDDGRTVFDLIEEAESLPRCRYWLARRESSGTLELWWEIEACKYTQHHRPCRSYIGTGIPILDISK